LIVFLFFDGATVAVVVAVDISFVHIPPAEYFLKFCNNTIAIIALLQDWSQSFQKSLKHKKIKR